MHDWVYFIADGRGMAIKAKRIPSSIELKFATSSQGRHPETLQLSVRKPSDKKGGPAIPLSVCVLCGRWSSPKDPLGLFQVRAATCSRSSTLPIPAHDNALQFPSCRSLLLIWHCWMLITAFQSALKLIVLLTCLLNNPPPQTARLHGGCRHWLRASSPRAWLWSVIQLVACYG
jgi:hypothetical protein